MIITAAITGAVTTDVVIGTATGIVTGIATGIAIIAIITIITNMTTAAGAQEDASPLARLDSGKKNEKENYLSVLFGKMKESQENA